MMPACGTNATLGMSPFQFDRHGSPLDISYFLQALTECGHHGPVPVGRCLIEKPDHWHRRLLRPRRERPRRRAAEQRDERAALHSITSSARASSIRGISDTKDLCRLEILNVRFAQRL